MTTKGFIQPQNQSEKISMIKEKKKCYKNYKKEKTKNVLYRLGRECWDKQILFPALKEIED